MPIVTFFVIILCLITGLSVLIACPKRPSNLAFFTFSMIQASWLACVLGAMLAGAARAKGEKADLEYWFRANALVASFAPWSILFLKNAITSRCRSILPAFFGAIPFLIICIFLAFLCHTENFIILGHDSYYYRGSSYFLHSIIGMILYSLAAAKIVQQLEAQTGIRRLELQYLALSSGLGVLVMAILNALGNFLNIRALNRASVFVVFLAFIIMAWALAHHRIFNARHALAAVSHRFATVGLLAGSGWGLSRFFVGPLPESAAWLLGVFLCGLLVVWLDEKSRIVLGLGDGMILSSFRSEVIHMSRMEAAKGRLVEGFEQLLAHHFTAPSAAIMVRTEAGYAGNGISISRGRSAFRALCICTWITPESLQRRRITSGFDDLAVFLEQHDIGAMVSIPRGSPDPIMLVAVATKSNEWPFTFPEVQRLQSVAELIEGILLRSQLTDQVAMQAKMEHLALMSRGLAHDLKNLLTPISSFLVHSDGRFEKGTIESDVHIAARRSSRLMAEYLRESLFFSDRLEPKFETTDTLRIIARVREAITARAQNRGVVLVTENHFLDPFTADGVLVQRLLAKLIGNAIDASVAGQTVTLRTESIRPAWVRLQVSDEGRGIAASLMDRIFDPYFTTKDVGTDVRGMGLGLAISQRIVLLHRGAIVVNSHPGQGTNVIVDLPVNPLREAAAEAVPPVQPLDYADPADAPFPSGPVMPA